MSTVAVILAADSSSGFESSRYTSIVRGTPVLDRVVSDARTWLVDDIVVVLGADAEEVVATCDLSGTSILIDPEWSEGEAAPVRAVLDLLSRDRAILYAVMARGDQPGVEPSIVASLLEAATDSDAWAVIPKYRYARGWPLVIRRDLWDVFMGLEGSIDLHDVLASHAVTVEEVWIDQLAPITFESSDDLPDGR
jgi:CTP:molybdopterin cytidylyltransferase MocA